MVLHALCALLRRRLDALAAAPEKMGRVRAGAHRVFFRASDGGLLSLSHDCPLKFSSFEPVDFTGKSGAGSSCS